MNLMIKMLEKKNGAGVGVSAVHAQWVLGRYRHARSHRLAL